MKKITSPSIFKKMTETGDSVISPKTATVARCVKGGAFGLMVLMVTQVWADPAADYSANWARFRGPAGTGVAERTNVPAQWDGPSNKGILWKTALPLPGENSPIVWGKKIFLSGATADKRSVFCFNADTGKILWEQSIQMPGGKKDDVPSVLDEAGFAASTMATDGQRVYAIFANGILAALDFDGNLVWSKNLGPFQIQYGYATSLVTHQGAVIVLLDLSNDENENAIVAFDGATGAEKWRTTRPGGNSWATPIIAQTTVGPQIITDSKPFVISYNPVDGKEIWRVSCLDGDVVPSPVFAGGQVFSANSGSVLAVIKPDGKGDVTSTHISWKTENGLPDVASPVTNGELLWMVTSSGVLTCYKAKGGTKVYEHELQSSINSSPSLIGNKVYFLNSEGTMIVIDAGEQYKELGRFNLGEPATTTPAFMDGRIYIRGKTNLYSIGS